MNVEISIAQAEVLIAVLTGAEHAFALANPPLVEALHVLRPWRSSLIRTYVQAIGGEGGRSEDGDVRQGARMTLITFTHAELTALRKAVGALAYQPCGVDFYLDHGTPKPYRISDDWVSESYATFNELLDAAHQWKAAFEEHS